MLNLKGRLRSLLTSAGKGEKKVASVFSGSAAASHLAVLHLRTGAPTVPVWLFTTAAPLDETAALCERVYCNENSLALLAKAQAQLWKRWVAISVGTWTGERGSTILNLAPFMIPPFRVLILNGSGDFFDGTPANLFIHCTRLCRETIHAAGVHAQNVWQGLARLFAATGLRVLAILLGWIRNPHLRFFNTVHGNQPLLMDSTLSTGEGVVRFVQSGPLWDAEALEQLARSSDARWVLWQSAGESDAIHDGVHLFDDARTFAASPQIHFRGWRHVLFATAPFRKLQPGEATRVLAPLAGSILVDRAKLLALGIPRCSMPGTAWLILFWKAAAAGWRSYSIGQRTEVKEQPDSPIQDTAFVLQTIGNPALRRLGARQEELSRGNISFAPALARMSNRSSERLKVLLVSPFLPYPLSHGGAVRMFNLCRELSDRVEFTLVAMREAKDVVDYATLHEVFGEVYVVDRDERTVDDSQLPAQVSASESSSLRALIAQLSLKMPDLLQIEYTHFAAFRYCAPGVPALLVEHDLTFSLYRQLAEASPSAERWSEYERWLAFERKWLEAYECVWTVCDEDRRRAIEEGQRSGERTFAIANGVDVDRFRPTEEAVHAEVFYVGSFRHLPNIIGFEKLCQEVMPRVWAKAPDTRLRVVAGPEHEFFWEKFGREQSLGAIDARIEVLGFVEDLRPLYARAAVVAVPLEISAGTNIKVLEAMACGKAIVTTPVGCAGLGLQDQYQAAIREGWEEFSDAVLELLSKTELRSGLGAQARREAENRFSWTAIADQAYESYLAMTSEPAYRDKRINASAGQRHRS